MLFIMITNESQVRVTVSVNGARRGVTASSTINKGKTINTLKTDFHECNQSLLISSEAVQNFISLESRPSQLPPSTWKKFSKQQRLEWHLQRTADFIASKDNAKYSYQVIN